jgi:hypothetical protein
VGKDLNVAKKAVTQPGSPRFRSSYDLRGLISIVAAVAPVALPEDPAKVPQRRYDAARATAGYPDAPTAKQTAARLGMPWKEVLSLALDPTRSVDSVLGERGGEEDQLWLTAEDVRAALRIVARRLNKTTLKPVEYRLERRRMLDAAKRSYRHHSELSLPTSNQIETTAGSWAEALVIAGLKPRQVVGAAGIPITAVLELFLETHGFIATFEQMEAFARVQQFPLANRRKPFTTYIAELQDERAEWGKWTPAKSLRGMEPKLDTPAPGLVGLLACYPEAQKRKKRWTSEECIRALAQLLAEWPNDRRLTENAYQDYSRGRADLPSLSTIQRTGSTFRKLVEEARTAAL